MNTTYNNDIFMCKYYIIVNDSVPGDWCDIAWMDVANIASVFLQSHTIKNPWLIKLKKIHFSNRINRKLWLPFKNIWDKTLPIGLDDIDKNNKNVFIFQSSIKFSPSFIKRLKIEKNATIVMYMPDTVNVIGWGKDNDDVKRYLKKYHVDQVYSFDPEDCRKYGFSHQDFYSTTCIDNVIKDPKLYSDILYIGNARTNERLQLLYNLFDKIQNVLNPYFSIVGVPYKWQKFQEKICFNKYMNYENVLKYVFNTNCLVEIVNQGQAGFTLRSKEAIVFNKRLLTNNPYILKSEYYNPDYILYFEKIEDIDVEWLTQKVHVDYKYKGEFSPKEMFKIINSKL